MDLIELEQMIYKVKEQLDFHKRRADAEERRANEAERKLQEYAEHLHKVNQARLLAQQEANKANEELRLYKIQLDYAQKEINRAQGVLDLVEKQRAAAEREAAEAKAKARKLNEEIVIETARREGRRQGLQEGLDRGRKLIMQEVEAATNVPLRRSSFALERASFMDDDYGTDSDDTRTISTESHVTLQADRRPRPRSEAAPASVRAPSPPPMPIPSPRPPSRATSAVRAPTRPVSRASTVVPEPKPASLAPSAIGEARPASRASSAVPDPRPPSRAPSVMADNTRPPSRGPSNVGETRPPSRAASVAQEPPPSHSRGPSISHYTPTPVHVDYTIPPDNLIPTLVDGVISIPPAFEFHRMPTTPEKPAPQRLPTESFDSTSTTLSAMDLLNDPYNAHVATTPALSAIEEVSSSQVSPYPQDWKRHSVAGSSVGRGEGGSVAGSPYIGGGSHQRRQSTSSFVPSIHERPPSAMSRVSKSNTSAAGTPIYINVQPPSHPGTEGTRSIPRSEQGSPFTAAGVPLPSSYMGSPAASTQIPMRGAGSQLGISRAPSPTRTAKDDDAVSSRISNDGDFFTTPKIRKAESVLSGVSGRTSKTSRSKASRHSRQ